MNGNLKHTYNHEQKQVLSESRGERLTYESESGGLHSFFYQAFF